MIYTVPFLIGLFSAFHCVGMCGGIMTALTLGLAPEIRASGPRLLLYVLLYNVGRLFAYMAAGALIAGLVAGAGHVLAPEGAQAWLQRLAALVLVLIGLHLAGWLPQLHRIERIGVPLWKRIEPLARSILPARHWWQALSYGALWGWVPCGMVYTMLIAASTQGSAFTGGAYMLLFGLGTLLPVTAAGLFAGKARNWLPTGQWRRLLGLVVLLYGAVNLFYPDYVLRLGVHSDMQPPGVCIGPSR